MAKGIAILQGVGSIRGINQARFLRFFAKGSVGVWLFLFLFPLPGDAGVFNLPHFVPSGEFSLGVEPDLMLAPTSNLGMNLKYTQGLSDLDDLTITFGTGGETRQFRLGGTFSYDFFPDAPRQPGLGLALQSLYVTASNLRSLELTAIPYIHKTLKTDLNRAPMEPFIALPIGFSLSQGSYQTIANLAFGCLFLHHEHFRTVVEFGVALSNSQSYLSGGVIYYP